MTAYEHNPYATPELAAAPWGKTAFRPHHLASLAWPALLILNLIMPLLFLFIMTSRAGWVGIAAASAIILLAGWYFCWRHTKLAWQTIVGMAVLAVTQFCPVLQVAAGVCGLMAGGTLGLKSPGVPGQPYIDTAPLGFVSVLVAGAVLITMAALLGWLLRFVLPKRWSAAIIPAPPPRALPC